MIVAHPFLVRRLEGGQSFGSVRKSSAVPQIATAASCERWNTDARGMVPSAVVGLVAATLLASVVAFAQAACVAPDPVRFPLSWQGDLVDHNCTADETKAYDRSSFSFMCTPVNCQMKYGTDTSDQQFGFDDSCRLCRECTGEETENCVMPSVIVDDGCASVGTCESTVDCGPYGINLGLYACECNAGYKTDVTSGSYCSVADITGVVSNGTINSGVDEAGTDIIIAVAVILSSVVLIAVCVGTLSMSIRNKKGAFYPSGRPINDDPNIISFNMICLLIDGEQSEVISALSDSIHWPPKSLTVRPGAHIRL
jgi:hypothetical protein